MSNKVGYALLIHGCPVAASYNVTSAELVYFADFIADGGVFESSLASLPNVTQSVDPLGGFSKVSDLSFDLLGQDFIRFFGTRKETVYTLSSDLLPGDVSIYLDGVTDGTSGLVYLPKETVEIGIVTSGVASILTRSVYSAFQGESVSEYFPVSELVGGIDISLAAGHWNHYGRWVVLYRYDGSEWTIAYAGTIDGVSIQGLKTTLQTKSLTSLYERNLCNWSGKLKRELYTCPMSLEIHNMSGAVVGGIAEAETVWDIAAELERVSNDIATSSGTLFAYVINPTRARIFKGGGSAPTSTDCFDPSNSHPALVQFLHLTAPTATTDYPDGFDMSDLSSVNLEAYNYILLPGSTFAFDEQVSEPVKVDQYFLFDSGEKQLIVPCVYDSGTGWSVDVDPVVPWFDTEGNWVYADDQWLVLSTETCVIKPVLTTGLQADLVAFLLQVIQRDSFPWYTALNLPSCLIDSDTFGHFGYELKPVILEETTLADAFDQVLKIAGLCIVFEGGKLVAKRVQYLEDNGFLPEIGKDVLIDEFPTFELGYVAPLSSLEIKFDKFSKNYIFNMPDPLSGALNKLTLEDKFSTQDQNVSEVAYRALYYFSKHTPTISVQTVSNAGNVGDLVSVTSKYLPSGLGLVEDTYTGLIVEKSESEIYEYKITLFPTPLTDFCMLAPSGFLDFTQGTYGKDVSGYLHFTSVCNLTSFPKFLNSLGFPVLLDLLLVNNLGEFCILRDCQNDYENDQILWDNTWPTIMSGIDWAYLTTLPWEAAS